MKALLILLLAFSPLFSAEKVEAKQYSFLLPINWASNKHYSLFVKIPDGFKGLQPLSEMTKESRTIAEFIPEDEEEDNWSEIITVVKYIGKKLSADKVAKILREGILDQSADNKVWKQRSSQKGDYLETALGITYKYQGTREVLGASYYSGPYDCAGVQYTIRPRKKLSEEEAMRKIEQFFESNVSVQTS